MSSTTQSVQNSTASSRTNTSDEEAFSTNLTSPIMHFMYTQNFGILLPTHASLGMIGDFMVAQVGLRPLNPCAVRY